jgi:hypothetical protein
MPSASDLTAKLKARVLVNSNIVSPAVKHSVTESSRKKLKFMGRQRIR